MCVSYAYTCCTPMYEHVYVYIEQYKYVCKKSIKKRVHEFQRECV